MLFLRLLGDIMNGILNVFKPKGITSYDVVAKVKKELNIKKVGHTGTLDPMASGVLILCIGKATKISQYITASEKDYIGELTLGYETDTQDSEGKIINCSDKKVTHEQIIETFNSFQGELNQVPPMYSAVRHKGKKLYELARMGKTVERKARKITIYKLKTIDILENRKILFYTKCSSGTYIRTLCNDIGYRLGTYGYMSYLMRTKVGALKIEDSIGLNYIKRDNKDLIKSLLLPMDEALKDYPSIEVEDIYYKKILNGMMVPTSESNEIYVGETQLVRVYSKGQFIGIGKIIIKNGQLLLKMVRVLA